MGMEIDSNYFSIAKERTLRTQELIKKYGVNDPEHLMLLAQKNKLQSDMQNVASNILKNPKCRQFQNELFQLEKAQEVCIAALKRFDINQRKAA